ncbi:MAG: hypothetical protein AB1758_31955, partial [Candidatus Eremiobacterota bacterium]
SIASQDRGLLEGLTRSERIAILEKMIAAHPLPPGTTLEHASEPGSLEVLKGAVNRFMDGNVPVMVGEKMVQVPIYPPTRRISLLEAVDVYTDYLARLASVPARAQPELTLEDVEWARDAAQIELNHLDRTPSEAALFRRLVGMFQCVGLAYGALQVLDGLRPEQETVLAFLRDDLGRAGRGHPDDWSRTRAQGERLRVLLPRLAQAVPALRPGDTVAGLIGQLDELGDLSDWELARVVPWRGPGQTLKQGRDNLHRIRDALDFLPEATARELGERLARRASDAEEHGRLMDDLKEILPDVDGNDRRDLLFDAVSASEPLADGFRRRLREFDLTGKREGLDPIRAAIRQGLEEGRFKGSFEPLMERYEHILLHRRVHGEDKQKAVKQALAELEELQDGSAPAVKLTRDAVWVGGSRVKVRPQKG